MDPYTSRRTRNVNLIVNSITDKGPKPVGKVCEVRGRRVFHEWVKGRYQRHDLQAWGINMAVIEYCEKHGIEDLYLYSAAEDKTYATHVGLLKEYGTESSPHDWGHNLNLPIEEWSVIPGKLTVPWVPAECAVKLQPKRIIVKEEVPVKEVDDALAQSNLF